MEHIPLPEPCAPLIYEVSVNPGKVNEVVRRPRSAHQRFCGPVLETLPACLTKGFDGSARYEEVERQERRSTGRQFHFAAHEQAGQRAANGVHEFVLPFGHSVSAAVIHLLG